MAITDKETGVWGIDQVYNKINQGSIWSYSGSQQLWMAGQNTTGVLGQNSTTTQYSSPVQIYGGGSTWSEIITPNAGSRALALKTDGTIWTWGPDAEGNLGLNDQIPRSSPIQIGSGTDWTSIAAGTNSAMAVKSDNTLWMWGYNNYGQLANIQHTAYKGRSSPIQVPGEWSENITSTASRTGAVKTDGTLWMWGQNYGGVLGQNRSFTPNYKGYSSPVQVGSDTTWSTSKGRLNMSVAALAVKTDGTLWGWGQNANGQLGLNSKTEYSSPVQVGSDTTWGWVMTFGGSSAAVKTDGTLWSWGYNNLGMLGHNNQTEYSSPKQVGSGTNWSKTWQNETTACGLKTDGTAWMWGRNSQRGQQGHNNLTDYSSPKQVPGNYIWLDINNMNAGFIKEL
tara:strand:- start:54 stop:1238 length:1185 start_codon:yes stop_codon:yes gene_type:complete